MPGIAATKQARALGHGTVRPRRIRAITGELRAMARMQAWL